MTREERRQQLRALTTTDDGRDQLLAIWHKATGTPLGMVPAPGTLLIQEILHHEFPPDGPEAADPNRT